MKSALTILFFLTSVVAQANSFNIFVPTHTYDPAECDAAVAKIATALAGQPIKVVADQQVNSEQSGNGDGANTVFTPGECNATLSSTGSAQIQLTTLKFKGDCTSEEMADPRLAGAVYTSAYYDISYSFNGCAIDMVTLK